MFAEFKIKHGAALCIALDSYCTVVRAHDIAGYGKPKSSPCAMLFVTAPQPLEHLFTSPEMESLKARLKATWMAGDYGLIAKSIEPCAEEFVTRLALKSGTRLLDVACGNGNVAIPAARAKAAVTGVDIAVNLLEQTRARAESEGLVIQFDNGDAERLPYEDAAFEVVVSMFGAMFAPRPELAAAELVRVCRPGGRIAMANWMPAGFAG